MPKKHSGKSDAVNFGISKARNQIVIVLDADSEIEKNALVKIMEPFGDPKVAGVSGILRAKQNRNPLTWFQDLEYMLASGSRYLFNKVNATYFLPGFAAFRKKALQRVGGFSKTTFSEDLDIGLQLKKAGYKLEMSDATIHTRVPETITGLVKQRVRWCLGTLQVLRKHSDMILNRKYGMVGVYCVPLQVFWYFYGLIYVPIALYQIFGGYIQNFAAYGNYFSIEVAKYFFNWLSAYGMAEYVYNTFTGVYPTTVAFYTLLIMFLLYMTYNLLMVNKFSKLSLRFLFVIFFQVYVCGEGLGHASRSMAVGEALIKGGHEVSFHTYGSSKKHIEDNGFKVTEIPPEIKLVGKAGSLDIKKTLKATVRNMKLMSLPKIVNQVREDNPDAIVSDSYFLPVIAAKLRKVPVYLIVNQTKIHNYLGNLGLAAKAASKVMKYSLEKTFHSVNKVVIPDFPPPWTICKNNINEMRDVMYHSGPLVRKMS